MEEDKVKDVIAEIKPKLSLLERLKAAWSAEDNVDRTNSMFGSKFERCAENLLVVTGSFTAIGLITSLVIFSKSPKKAIFTVGMSTGIGVGTSYSTCNMKVYGKDKH